MAREKLLTNQDELFSLWANQVLQTTVTVYASRGQVNIVVPRTGYGGEGNHVYARPRGALNTWLTDLVRHTILEAEKLSWLGDGWSLVGPDASYVERGKYTFMVWRPKH